jgi:hypothetical protein
MTDSRRGLLGKLLTIPFAAAALAKAAFARVAGSGGTVVGKEAEYRSLGRNILRFLNTGQAWHKRGAGNGSYAELKELSGSEALREMSAKLGDHPQLGAHLHSQLRFGEREIVPGWKFDFRVSDDRSGYIAVLTDVSGKMLGTLSTDERGVIYEGVPLDAAQELDLNALGRMDAPSVIPAAMPLTPPERTFSHRIRELLKSVALMPYFICPCYRICGGEKVCCHPCCILCNQTCDGSVCSCCVNVGCLSCVWCCGQ